MAAAAPFVFGKFLLYEVRDAYTLAGAEVENYFREIAGDMEAACYGSYFLEMADYYGRENIDATETLRHLPVPAGSFKAVGPQPSCKARI